MGNKYVWYVGYGSNLNKQRFLCYIQGGKPTYGRRSGNGCTNKTLPLQDSICKIPYQVYFALPHDITSTSNWGNGGVAFLRNIRSEELSLGRMWKIAQSQYEEIKDQEGRKWYDKEIFLGTKESAPIYTITNSKELNNILPPSETYLKTLIEGLRESFNMRLEDAVDYLMKLDGVKEKMQRKDLLKI